MREDLIDGKEPLPSIGEQLRSLDKQPLVTRPSPVAMVDPKREVTSSTTVGDPSSSGSTTTEATRPKVAMKCPRAPQGQARVAPLRVGVGKGKQGIKRPKSNKGKGKNKQKKSMCSAESSDGMGQDASGFCIVDSSTDDSDVDCDGPFGVN